MTNGQPRKSRKTPVSKEINVSALTSQDTNQPNKRVSLSKDSDVIQAEKRQQSRDIVLTEFIFVLIPFIFLGIVSIEQSFTGFFNAVVNLALGPELALVSSLLFGQTCVKLISGLAKKNIPKWHLGTKKAAGFLALTMICAFLYARISTSHVKSTPYAIIQVILFIYAIESFIVFGSIGQRLMDMPDKTDHE
jgi:hypothetical protein